MKYIGSNVINGDDGRSVIFMEDIKLFILCQYPSYPCAAPRKEILIDVCVLKSLMMESATLQYSSKNL